MVDFPLVLHKVVEASLDVVEVSSTGDHSRVTTTAGELPEEAMVEALTVDSVDLQMVDILSTRQEEALVAATIGVQEVQAVFCHRVRKHK